MAAAIFTRTYQDYATDYQCSGVSSRATRLQELASQYHEECEAYDQSICSILHEKYGAMLATNDELAKINKNALAVRRKIFAVAEDEGFTWRELVDAIGRWDVVTPNKGR